MKTKILTLLVFSLIGLYTYGEQYGVLVNKANGTNEVNFFEAPRTEDFGYDVQFLAHVQVEAGDYCQLYHADFETEGNCMDLWMCDLDPYSESDFVKNGDYLYATRAGCYDFYIKFGYYNRNLLYIGNGTNCITSDIILPKIKVGNLYYDLNIQDHTAEVGKNACAYHSNVQGGTDYNNLLSITIPDYIVYNNVPFRVTSIGDAVFSSCKGLTSVELPNTLKSIGWEAFYNCSNLSTVTIPDSVINIGPKAFGGCNSLASVVWNAKNCEDLYHSSYIFGDAPTTFIFGDNVEYIPNFICEGMTNLRSVTLGNNIKRIGVQAFIGNVSISSIVFPNSLTNIGDGAFSSCNGLTSVIIPNSVVSIGKDAFGECENLQVLTIGHNLANIGDYAFRLCYSLDTIYNYAPVPQMIEESVFLGVDKNACCLIVPDISETLYRSAWVWKDFFSINTIVSDSIYGINHETFNVTISAGSGGSVMPELNEFEMPANTNININAFPDNGYRFVSWSDGNTNANRTIVVNSNISLEAQFEAITYCTLYVQVEPEESGIVLFDGKESTSMDIIVEEGNTIQLTAVPQRGYRFVHYIDGINIITDTKYNVTMTTSKSITVVFEEKPITPPTPADNTPTVDDLEEAGYHVEDSVVVCLYFDEAPCNDVYMTGNYRTNSSGGWSTDINELKRFEALPGFSGWYAVEIPYTNNAMGKPVQLTSDGRFSWDYQCGDVNAWIYKGGERAGIYSGFFDESDVFYYNPGCYIYELAYWKNHNNPCIIIPKHNYTIQLYTPEACSSVIPAVIGSFNNWNDFLPMSESTDLQGRKVFTYTLYGEEGQDFIFADSELGWYNELQYWNQSIGSWMAFNNYILPEASKDTTLIFDYSDNTKYRFSLCQHAENVNVTTLQANATHNAVVVAWPAEDGATEYIIELEDDIDIVYTLYFNANGQLLVYYAPSRNGMSLQTQMATQTGTGWQYTITDLEPNTEYLYTVTAIYGDGSIAYQQSLVFSTQNAPTAIDQITDAPSGITRKVIQNGQVLILRGDKTYTLQGQEIK